ncbi:MAG: hypothetical protein OEL88_00020 [Sterolibacteriaceae bacterium MAG5]|nr:hypothetical protein [Candidatus Nitricoxidireducens bremensis]
MARGILAWLDWLGGFFVRDDGPPEIRAARALITAVDAGGVPLNPARVNAIARDLGLEVSRQEAVEQTIARIRAALARHDGGGA